MNLLLAFVVHTANVLSAFNDPFEFAGDYGSEVNPIREQVFEIIVPREALAKNLSDHDVQTLMPIPSSDSAAIYQYRLVLIEQAAKEDQQHGPLVSQLVTPSLIHALTIKQYELQEAGFTSQDLEQLIDFIHRYGDQHAFYFLKNSPSSFLNLDKALRDRASKEGKPFAFSILSSTHPLKGLSSEDLKLILLNELFTEEHLRLTKSTESLLHSLNQMNPVFLTSLLGENARVKDLHVFCTPAGQLFFYWLYQSLHLHLISEDFPLVEQVNTVKEVFAKTLADPKARAAQFRQKIINANSSVVFTQESDLWTIQSLIQNDLFHSVDQQNLQDGTLVFLKSSVWAPDYQVLDLSEYSDYLKGRVNLILATHLETNQKFLLASAHGNSTDAADGRLQVRLIAEKFELLRNLPQNHDLQLLIGIDANTKTQEDIEALKKELDQLGLIATQAGPTTVKQRMVSVQHAKAGKFAIDEEDYLITLKPENSGNFLFDHVTVGFSEDKPDLNQPLPNLSNLSDHYPVGATIVPLN